MEREDHCKGSSTPVLKCLCARLQSAECNLGGACSWSHTAVLAVSLDVQCSVSSMLPFLLCIVCVLKYAAHTVAVKFCNTCPMSTAGAGEGGGAGAGGGAAAGAGEGGEGGAVNIAHLANSCSLPCAQILHLFPTNSRWMGNLISIYMESILWIG